MEGLRLWIEDGFNTHLPCSRCQATGLSRILTGASSGHSAGISLSQKRFSSAISRAVKKASQRLWGRRPVVETTVLRV